MYSTRKGANDQRGVGPMDVRAPCYRCAKAGVREIVDKEKEKEHTRKGWKEKASHERKDMLEVWRSMRTRPKTATSDYMFMKWTKRSKDHGEEAELEPKASVRGLWALREVKGVQRGR